MVSGDGSLVVTGSWCKLADVDGDDLERGFANNPSETPVASGSKADSGLQSIQAVAARAPENAGSGSKKLKRWMSMVLHHEAPTTGCAGAAGWAGFKDTIRQHPRILLVPLFLLLLGCGLGLWAVFSAAHSEMLTRQDDAERQASRLVRQLEMMILSAVVPAKGLASFVKRTAGHNVEDLRIGLPAWAAELREMTGTGNDTLQLCPSAIILLGSPENPNNPALGLDILQDPFKRPLALRAIETQSVLLQGPFMTRQGYLAGVVRVPIFVNGTFPANETFGAPHPSYNCTAACYPPGRTFWGFGEVVLRWTTLRAAMALDKLESDGLYHRLMRPWDPHDGDAATRPDFLLSESTALQGRSLQNYVTMPVFVPGAAPWMLTVAPVGSWTPVWKWPCVAATIVASLLAAGLLLYVLEANRRLRVTSAALSEEKERLDVLLVGEPFNSPRRRSLVINYVDALPIHARQFDLIQCLGAGGNRPSTSISDSGKCTLVKTQDSHGQPRSSAPTAGRHRNGGGETLVALDASFSSQRAGDRIEAIRNEMSRLGLQPGNEHVADDVVLTELLGQGTFGKVYKGMWRGSVVAVKTIILPASLTNDEKREKMAIMEAAISSSLSHPNIVQTYTYKIKQLRDSSAATSRSRGPSRNNSANAGLGTADTGRLDSPSSASASVHSFEVQLLLEFCDKGCLRDALHDGAFFTKDGVLNLAGILETAADVARAMVHLHASNVLHSDLKATNVMLKSGGSDGRGVTAKIVDFGLSVRMDMGETHVSSMFQGTVSHMAPEVLLEGRLSKAADVYAFGITLYELFTAGVPYQGMAKALLPQKIAEERVRPELPLAMPAGLRNLIVNCWAHDMDARPTFNQILSELLAMRDALRGPTPPLCINNIPSKERARSQRAANRTAAGQPRSKLPALAAAAAAASAVVAHATASETPSRTAPAAGTQATAMPLCTLDAGTISHTAQADPTDPEHAAGCPSYAVEAVATVAGAAGPDVPVASLRAVSSEMARRSVSMPHTAHATDSTAAAITRHTKPKRGASHGTVMDWVRHAALGRSAPKPPTPTHSTPQALLPPVAAAARVSPSSSSGQDSRSERASPPHCGSKDAKAGSSSTSTAVAAVTSAVGGALPASFGKFANVLKRVQALGSSAPDAEGHTVEATIKRPSTSCSTPELMLADGAPPSPPSHKAASPADHKLQHRLYDVLLLITVEHSTLCSARHVARASTLAQSEVCHGRGLRRGTPPLVPSATSEQAATSAMLQHRACSLYAGEPAGRDLWEGGHEAGEASSGQSTGTETLGEGFPGAMLGPAARSSVHERWDWLSGADATTPGGMAAVLEGLEGPRSSSEDTAVRSRQVGDGTFAISRNQAEGAEGHHDGGEEEEEAEPLVITNAAVLQDALREVGEEDGEGDEREDDDRYMMNGSTMAEMYALAQRAARGMRSQSFSHSASSAGRISAMLAVGMGSHGSQGGSWSGGAGGARFGAPPSAAAEIMRRNSSTRRVLRKSSSWSSRSRLGIGAHGQNSLLNRLFGAGSGFVAGMDGSFGGSFADVSSLVVGSLPVLVEADEREPGSTQELSKRGSSKTSQMSGRSSCHSVDGRANSDGNLALTVPGVIQAAELEASPYHSLVPTSSIS